MDMNIQSYIGRKKIKKNSFMVDQDLKNVIYKNITKMPDNPIEYYIVDMSTFIIDGVNNGFIEKIINGVQSNSSPTNANLGVFLAGRIFVNKQLDARFIKLIIAHELVHLLLKEYKFKTKEEEEICNIVEFSYAQNIDLWEDYKSYLDRTKDVRLATKEKLKILEDIRTRYDLAPKK